MLMEPMVFYSDERAMDWIMDNYYLSDNWNVKYHKKSEDEDKHMMVFEEAKEDSNSAHKIFLQIIEEESHELKRIMQFIQ